MRRIDNPAEHFLPVYGFRPAFFHVAPREVVVEPFVFFGELGYATIFHVYGVDFIGTGKRMTLHQQLFLAGEERNEGVIGRVVGDLAQFPFEVGHVEVDFPMPYAGKVQPLAVGRPKEGIYTAVEAFGDVTLLAGTQFVDAETCAVAFISVALHAAPRNVLAVGRELRVLIVADVGILAVLRIDRLILQAAGVIGLARRGPTSGLQRLRVVFFAMS